jgi:hypothetical protein
MIIKLREWIYAPTDSIPQYGFKLVDNRREKHLPLERHIYS